MNKKLITSFITSIAIVASGYCFFLNHITPNQIGVAVDSWGGKITMQTNIGWYITSPTTKVITFDTLPRKVNLDEFGAKIVTTKIVKINTEYILDYLNREGFSYISSWSLERKLTPYAFSNQKFSFLTIVE